MLTTYERVSPDQIKWFNRIVFDSYEFPSPSTLAKIKNLDNRLASEVGWYVIENKSIISQVCYFIYDFKTTKGFEKAGIPFAVGTMHAYRRKGFGKQVMDKVHARMIEQDCSYSILTTSNRWKAYDWYRKMGYIEISTVPIIYGILEPYFNPSWAIRDYTNEDEAQLARLFNEVNKNTLGIIQRPINFITLRKLWHDKDINFKILEDNGKIVGFVNLTNEATNEISEIIIQENYPILEWLRFIAPGETQIFPSLHQYASLVKSSGLQCSESYAVMMIKDLRNESSEEDILGKIGFTKDKFALYSLDRF